jgi:hypothetical protein
MPAASFQYMSSNQKLSPVGKVPYTTGNPIFHTPSSPYRFRPEPKGPFCCSTYASIAATCTTDCPFKMDEQGNPGGCFVEAEHFTRKAMKNLDAAAAERDPLDVIREEASLIDRAFTKKRGGMPQDGARGGRDLRIHVGGDVPNEAAARVLAGASARWLARGGGRVWTYTHSWRRIPVHAFWPISVLGVLRDPGPCEGSAATWVRAGAGGGEVPEWEASLHRGGHEVHPLPGGDHRQDLRRMPALPRCGSPRDGGGDRLPGSR